MANTPLLDKYRLHPIGGYCTCFSNPYSKCEICEIVRAKRARWEALSPEVLEKVDVEYDREYPRTSNQDGR